MFVSNILVFFSAFSAC